MTLNDIISKRRSIRKYQDKPVDRGLLMEILEAGRLAPSASNRQQWHFLVVENRELRGRLAVACYDQQMVANAPLTLIVWSDEERLMPCEQSAAAVDCSIALSFMMLKATELELGTCWLGAFHKDQVKEVIGLPEKAVVVAITPIGWPDESPSARPRKSTEEICEIRE